MKKRTFLLLAFLFVNSLHINSQTYNYYYGNIHSHTSYSDGNKDSASSLITTPIQAFNYAKQSQHIDFYGISDHNHFAAGMTSPLHYRQGIQDANMANDDGTFVAMYGFEWGVISGGGHVIVYGCDSLMGWDNGYFDIFVARNDYVNLWKKVIKRPNSFAYLVHPQSGDYGNILNTSVNAIADSAIVGMAGRSGPAFSTNTGYSNPSTSDYITQYNNALKQGYHVGIGLDHDTHNSVFGRQSAGRLVVLAHSLTRNHIYDAFKKMRFYCSDDWNAKVNFQIFNQPMGSIMTHSGTPTISVSITDPDVSESVASITLYYGIPGSGSAPTILTTANNTSSLVYTHNNSNNSKYYYYLLIRQADGNKIWTSPIWYNRNDSYVASTPIANYSISTNTICVDQPVSFYDASTNAPTSWAWTANGANASSSTVQNPSFTYSISGTYTVSLIASNSAGSSSSFSQIINVNPTPSSPTITLSVNTLISSTENSYQWYQNGFPIWGEINQSYIPVQNGNYSVIASNANNCRSSMSNHIIVNTVGLQDLTHRNYVSIYPNPTSGFLNIEFETVTQNTQLKIINQLGQTVYIASDIDCDKTCLYTLDLHHLPNGIYTIKLKFDNATEYQKILLDN